MTRVLVSAGDVSGDAIAADLVHALMTVDREQRPDSAATVASILDDATSPPAVSFRKRPQVRTVLLEHSVRTRTSPLA